MLVAVERPGISPTELLRRVHRSYGQLTARELARWLLDEQLAEIDGGLLRPTARTVEIAGRLDWLGPSPRPRR